MTWYVAMLFVVLSSFADNAMDGVRAALGAIALAILYLAEKKR